MFSAILLLLFLVTIVKGSSQYQLSQADRDKILDYHNQIRKNYGLPNLVYDLVLESNASKYAGGCKWGHSTSGGKYGENLAQNSKSPAPTFPLVPWMTQVDAWYQEWKYWTCSTGACSSVCGHLTQIISAVTTAVGCGIADCDPGTVSGSMRSQYMVCQYTPPGNVNLGSKHPVSGQAYPYNGCPSSNPPIVDKGTPTGPVPTPPTKPPIGTPIVNPAAPVPVSPTPVLPPPTTDPEPQPQPPNPTQPWLGCKGDYWPGNPPVQKITPCNAAPKTFTTRTGTKKLYCDVKDPAGYLWPVINPGTKECNYVARLEEEGDASRAGNWPYYYWIGIALGIVVLGIIIAAIVFLVRKRGSQDERV